MSSASFPNMLFVVLKKNLSGTISAARNLYQSIPISRCLRYTLVDKKVIRLVRCWFVSVPLDCFIVLTGRSSSPLGGMN